MTEFARLFPGWRANISFLRPTRASLQIIFLTHATQQQCGPQPAFIVLFFMIIGVVFFLLVDYFVACVFAAVRFILSRRCYWFIFVVACFQFFFFLIDPAPPDFTTLPLPPPFPN